MGANGTTCDDRRTRNHEDGGQLSDNCRRYTQAVHHVRWDPLRACQVSRAVEECHQNASSSRWSAAGWLGRSPHTAKETIMRDRFLNSLARGAITAAAAGAVVALLGTQTSAQSPTASVT